MAEKKSEPRASWLPRIQPGRYSDGMPLDQMRYLQCKAILKPNRFTSRSSLFAFCKVLKRPARENGILFRNKGFADLPMGVREVQFLDTADFRLYNNAFILRQRIRYEDGFPVGDPEIVFKYRNPDPQSAAAMDLRPNIDGDYKIKFKAEALPLRNELGGIRMLYSHNVRFDLDGRSVSGGDPNAMDMIVDALPLLTALDHAPGERVELVNGTIVEEVLQDVGELDFHNGRRAVVNIGLWRTRGEHRPLVGELAFQLKFKRHEDMADVDLDRVRRFFAQLQWEARDWIQLGATKTGVVYRLSGNPPNAHE